MCTAFRRCGSSNEFSTSTLCKGFQTNMWMSFLQYEFSCARFQTDLCVCGFIAPCFIMWIVKLLFCTKCMSQTSYEYRFSPLWIFIWFINVMLCAKFFSQTSHEYSFPAGLHVHRHFSVVCKRFPTNSVSVLNTRCTLLFKLFNYVVNNYSFNYFVYFTIDKSTTIWSCVLSYII